MNEIIEKIQQERNYKLERVKKSKNDIEEIIPKEMQIDYLDQIHNKVFGVDSLQLYLERDVFNAKKILISEFLNDGFFWAQIVQEMHSIQYEDLYELMNSVGSNPEREYADLNVKYCVAKFQGEWFRAYIDEITPDLRLKVFFIDYGTTAVINRSDTCKMPYPEEDVWLIPPLCIPCIIKDMTVPKYAKLRKLEYPTYAIQSLKLIEKSCIFELELKDETGKNIINTL